MLDARISSSGMPSASSIAGSMTSAADLVPYSRSATSPASTMPGTRAGIRPATGMIPLNPPGSMVSTSPAWSLRCRKNSGGRGFRHGADAGDGDDLAFFRADQDGSLAAEAEVGILADGGGQHRRDTRVHGIAAEVEDTYSGFDGVVRAAGDGAAYPA